MKTWDNVTRDELVQELTEGVYATNVELQNKLNWTEYLRHMRDMLSMGMIEDPMITREHIQDVLIDIYMTMVRLVDKRGAEPEEIRKYISLPNTQETINALTEIALNLTDENWSEFRDKMCSEVGLNPSDFR